MSTRAQLQNHFLPRVLIPVHEICHLLLLSQGAARNKITDGTFPVPTKKVGKYRVVHLDDLLDFLFEAKKETMQ